MEGKKERKTRVSREGISISLPTTTGIPLSFQFSTKGNLQKFLVHVLKASVGGIRDSLKLLSTKSFLGSIKLQINYRSIIGDLLTSGYTKSQMKFSSHS